MLQHVRWLLAWHATPMSMPDADASQNACCCAGLGVKVTPNVSTGNGMDFLVGRISYTFGLQASAPHHLSCRPDLRRAIHAVHCHHACLRSHCFRTMISSSCSQSHDHADGEACHSLSQGPCISTHTACSSSLVATHLAASGLNRVECDAAVAAGVFLMLLQGTMAGICQLQVTGTPLAAVLDPVRSPSRDTLAMPCMQMPHLQHDSLALPGVTLAQPYPRGCRLCRQLVAAKPSTTAPTATGAVKAALLPCCGTPSGTESLSASARCCAGLR